jgi:hypothetical protein
MFNNVVSKELYIASGTVLFLFKNFRYYKEKKNNLYRKSFARNHRSEYVKESFWTIENEEILPSSLAVASTIFLNPSPDWKLSESAS